jgi:hypothetical protein
MIGMRVRYVQPGDRLAQGVGDGEHFPRVLLGQRRVEQHRLGGEFDDVAVGPPPGLRGGIGVDGRRASRRDGDGSLHNKHSFDKFRVDTARRRMTSGISSTQPTAITIAAAGVVAVSRTIHSDRTPTPMTGTPRPV